MKQHWAAKASEEKVLCDLKCESTLHSQSVDMLDSDVLSVGPLVSHRDKCNLCLYRIYSYTYKQWNMFNAYMIHQPGFCLNPTWINIVSKYTHTHTQVSSYRKSSALTCTFIKIDKHKESSWAVEWSWGQIKCTAAWFSDTHSIQWELKGTQSGFPLPLCAVCWCIMLPELLIQHTVTNSVFYLVLICGFGLLHGVY